MRKQKLKEISGIMKLFLSCRHLTNSQNWASALMISWERTEVKVQDPTNREKSNRRPFCHKTGRPRKFHPQEKSEPEVNLVHPFPYVILKGLQENLSSCYRREQGFLRGRKDKQAHTHICNPNSPLLGRPKPPGMNLVTKL